MNNVLQTKIIFLSNLFELQSISKSIINLKKDIEKISNDYSLDTFERKTRIRELNNKINILKEKLSKGIPIECDKLKKQVEASLISFLEPYGFNKEDILKRLQNIEFYITDEKVSSGGILSTYSNKVFIDYTIFEFDEFGNFLDFKEEKIEFIKYAFTHEFLHICSIRSNKSFNDDPLSEGYTDLLAQIISKNQKDKSKRYDFFVKVCALFTNLVGFEKTLDDYFNNLETLPNLTKLFTDCGIDNLGILEIKNNLNQIMLLQINDPNSNELFTLKSELIYKLKECLLIPFLRDNDINKENYINLFNNLFGEFKVNCSLQDIDFNVK